MNRSVSFSDNLLCSSSENNTARLTQGDSAELQQSLLSDRNLNNNKLKIKIYSLLKIFVYFYWKTSYLIFTRIMTLGENRMKG